MGLAAALLPGPIRIGPELVLDLNSFLVACLLTIVGTQLVTFGALATYYGVATGILPRGGIRRERIVSWCKTDRLVILGLILVITGGLLFCVALTEWAKVDFGDLKNPMVPRLVAAGLSIAIIGLQTGFSAFLFGILDIPLRTAR